MLIFLVKINMEICLPEGEYHKLQKLSNYKFSLAMENEISNGYLCEKLIHAKIAGNIPLFYGDDYAKKTSILFFYSYHRF